MKLNAWVCLLLLSVHYVPHFSGSLCLLRGSPRVVGWTDYIYQLVRGFGGLHLVLICVHVSALDFYGSNFDQSHNFPTNTLHWDLSFVFRHTAARVSLLPWRCMLANTDWLGETKQDCQRRFNRNYTLGSPVPWSCFQRYRVCSFTSGVDDARASVSLSYSQDA